MNIDAKKRILVAMSGGVDSSVAAALLKEQGHEVAGVTMQIWPESKCDSDRSCCSLSAVEDARYVAYQLDIPYHVFNFKEVFAQEVIQPFIGEYLLGRTPNPCILCNRKVKFESLLSRALALGFDGIATGHYGVVEFDENRGRWLLKKSSAAGKDQSYALYNLTQDSLSRLYLPIGQMDKQAVREKAVALGLDVADKPDSQEICFVEDNDYAAFIAREGYPAVPGDFVDSKGDILGRHKGIYHYTIGQRKGLGMTFGEPKYVIAIRPEENQVVLGSDEECFTDRLFARDLNFISSDFPSGELRIAAKIRYSQEESPAFIRPAGEDRVEVVFDLPQRAVTPGQSVVFYDCDEGDLVVGGGVIE